MDRDSGATTSEHARWVWYDQQSPRGLDHGYFRGKLSVSEIPDSAELTIAAESAYELWINGTWVARGSALSDPRWKAFDVVDIAEWLHPGNNVIAVLVSYVALSAQRGASSSSVVGLQHDIGAILRRDVPPAGLLVQLEASFDDGRVIRTGTGSDWRGVQAHAWWDGAPRLDDVVYQEIVDGRLEPLGWTDEDFDDTAWQRVVPVADVTLRGSEPRPSGHHGLWRLEPHGLPVPRRRWLHPAAIVEAGEVLASVGDWDRALVAERLTVEHVRQLDKARIEDADALVNGSGPATVMGSDPSEDPWTFDGLFEPVLVLDFGRLANARLELDIEGEDGAIIEVGYAPHLEGDAHLPGFSSRNRQADRYVLREGRQTWRTFNWRHLRYVKLVARNLTQPLTIHSVRVEEETYGDPERGTFASSDERLSRLWDPSVATTRLCTLDRYMDNPSRERKQWSGDVSPIALAALATYGPTSLHRRYFSFFFRLQTPSGHLPKLAPWHQNLLTETEILDHALWIFVRAAEYHLYSADETIPSLVRRAAEPFIENLERFEDADGIIDRPPFRTHFDWAPVDRSGTSFLLNAIYVLALESASSLLEAAGDGGTATQLSAKAERLRCLLRDRFWIDERQCFADSLDDSGAAGRSSEHGLAMSLLAGIANDQQAHTAVAAWQAHPESFVTAQPSFMLQLLEGLVSYGRLDLAVDTLADRFGRFVDKGHETFGELWSLWGNQGGTWSAGISATAGNARERWFPRDSRAIAQGAGAWPGWFLHRHVLGIQPTTPGFATFDVAPGVGPGRDHAHGSVPIRNSAIEVAWAINDGRLEVQVSHPTECDPNLRAPTGWQAGDRQKGDPVNGTATSTWVLTSEQ